MLIFKFFFFIVKLALINMYEAKTGNLNFSKNADFRESAQINIGQFNLNDEIMLRIVYKYCFIKPLKNHLTLFKTHAVNFKKKVRYTYDENIINEISELFSTIIPWRSRHNFNAFDYISPRLQYVYTTPLLAFIIRETISFFFFFIFASSPPPPPAYNHAKSTI